MPRSLLPNRFEPDAAYDPCRRAMAMLEAVVRAAPPRRQRPVRIYLLSAVFGVGPEEFRRRLGVQPKHAGQDILIGKNAVDEMVRDGTLEMSEWEAFVTTKCHAADRAKGDDW